MIKKVIAVELASVVANKFISYFDLWYAASKVALEASSGSPLT